MMMTKVMYASQALTEAQDAVMRIERILDAPVMADADPARASEPADDSIEFDCVTFSYPGTDRPALENVSLCVPAGATVALVGPSGSGKTTAASLVPRFWDACEGAVRIGGVDVRDIPLSSLMDRVAFVFQNDRLFKQSLADNIPRRPTRRDARGGGGGGPRRPMRRHHCQVPQWARYRGGARAASICRVASASASPLPGRSSKTLR